jgi:hypothetical protein
VEWGILKKGYSFLYLVVDALLLLGDNGIFVRSEAGVVVLGWLRCPI